GGAAWQDLYAFTLEPQLPVDFEVANYYVSTHPDSRFTKTLTVQRSGLEARHVLRDRDFLVDRGGQGSGRTIKDDAELLRVLQDVFGLYFPAGTRFPGGGA